jgi:hypothetical protein
MGARPAGGQLDPTRLASASEPEQKSILGEQLYPLIFQHEPQMAGAWDRKAGVRGSGGVSGGGGTL